MQDFEKLGVFYLGRPYNLAERKGEPGLLLYDSKDLVTHAVCVGMTGSGKTGLCVGLLEEAVIDGIPAIVIDPKGDLGNLLLAFPELQCGDFRPWINEDDARNRGLSPDEYAASQAELWRDGLAKWGQDGSRIRRFREAAEFTIYTPGSSAGVPVSIVKSFAAPDAAILEDSEALRERVSATATSLLGLLGIEGDALRSREHILLAGILGSAWQQGHDLDIAALIHQIQQPPFERLGVMDVESFYPSKERFSLAMQLNSLLASPGFEAWLEGEALDVGGLLYTHRGKPRVSIFSIAHLSDPERMFFVSLLLNQILSWTRTQSGTSSLRALVYMDEIFGYFPPVANPPSKGPLLTLLKQARAFGVGVVLATQNPVDLDYKGLANAGTWFIGRLQTERDKARVLEGLEGAAASAGSGFDRARMEQTLASLGSRVFLLNNVHEAEPVVFETRWTLSYLRGPLTRTQIKQLSQRRESAGTGNSAAPARAASADAVPVPGAGGGGKPLAPPDVPQFYLPVTHPGPVHYRPVVAGAAQLHFLDARRGIDLISEALYLAPAGDEPLPVDWASATTAEVPASALEPAEPVEGTYSQVPAPALKAANYAKWQRGLATWLYQNQKLELWCSGSSKLISRPGESERDFRARLQHAAREERDAAIEKLRAKYAAKLATLQEKVRRTEQAVERERDEAGSETLQTAVSVGASLLGAFFGRRSVGAATLGRSALRSRKQSQDVERARENLDAARHQLAELERRVEGEIAELQARSDPATETLETVHVRLKRADVNVRLVALVWVSQ